MGGLLEREDEGGFLGGGPASYSFKMVKRLYIYVGVAVYVI